MTYQQNWKKKKINETGMKMRPKSKLKIHFGHCVKWVDGQNNMP